MIVSTNFDASVSRYDEFERRYGLFRDLAQILARDCAIESGITVVDVGCGTGISSFALAEMVGTNGKVIGVDLSEGMLEAANENLHNHGHKNEPRFMIEHERMNNEGCGRIEFRRGDAEALEEVVPEMVDTVLYNATIFLVPNPRISCGGAFRILKQEGILGMNFLNGVFPDEGGSTQGRVPDDQGRRRYDVFTSARDQGWDSAPYGRRICDVAELPRILMEVGFRDVREGTVDIPMTRDQIMDFYSIPAQSAGLYPKTPYEERVKLLEELLGHLECDGILSFHQRWGWVCGSKRSRQG